jgi:hypothetical protein
MGIWSSIKKAAKAVWRAAKAVVRIAIRIVATVVMLGVNILDLALGFIGWPPKKMRLHVVILPIYTTPDERDKIRHATQLNIDQVERIWRERMNVHLRPYGKTYIEFFEGQVPNRALNPSCCGIDLFAQNTAGWVGVPISLTFPITVFVVADVQCKGGCSNGFFADYVVIDNDGLNSSGVRLSNSLMAHECLHACSLLGHLGGITNLIWPGNDRGDRLNWAQRNIIRSSRHVTYW